MIYEPIDGAVRYDIYLTVIEICNLRQYNGRAVSLHAVLQEPFNVLKELLNRNFFVCIISPYIDTYNRYKFNLRVGC